MTQVQDVTLIASAIGEPARGKMLNALMDGRALALSARGEAFLANLELPHGVTKTG